MSQPKSQDWIVVGRLIRVEKPFVSENGEMIGTSITVSDGIDPIGFFVPADIRNQFPPIPENGELNDYTLVSVSGAFKYDDKKRVFKPRVKAFAVVEAKPKSAAA